MKKFIGANKANCFVEMFSRGIKLYLFLFLLFISAQLSYAATGYKVTERTKVYTQEISANSLVLKVDNDFTVPGSLKLDLILENLESDSLSQFFIVVPAKVSGYILTKFRKKVSTIPFKLSYNWKIVLGDISKNPDKNYYYSYPFQKGNDYKVSQGPGGLFSHKDMYAYDFIMPIGTPILAARDGIVALLKTDSSTGGADKKFIDDANFISVYHNDGTIANYLHLNADGALVKEGQLVKKGDVIGYSGNTGFSSGPHLHFEILQPGIDFDKKKWISFNWDTEDDTDYDQILSINATKNSNPAL